MLRAVILFASCIVIPAVAQNFGEITGTVADQSGAVVAGASVIITNAATNQVRRLSTNDTGNYAMPFLVPRNLQR